MIIEDSFEVAAPQAVVWSAITDPAVMAPCIPGCEAIETLDDRNFRAQVKVKVGPIAANFVVEVAITEMVEPARIDSTTKGEEGSRASTLTAENWVRLEQIGESHTRVRYGSEVQLVGRLGRYGLGMMKKKAESLGQEFAKTFSDRVTAGETV